VWNALAGRDDRQRVALIDELSNRFHFFHWQLEFPEVFEKGGFDVMLGNPPWERIKLQEQEFFAGRDEEIARAPNQAAREKLIRALLAPEATADRQALGQSFVAAKRGAEAEATFARSSARFPLTAVGDINTYSLFGETFSRLLAAIGRAGVVIQSDILTGESTKQFFLCGGVAITSDC
jgi:hypothetical protein